MKKFIAMLLAVIMVLSLVACGTPAPTEPAPTDPAPTNPATPTDHNKVVSSTCKLLGVALSNT